jgi:CubicO group peptidase (beta-lactamase class C family)
VETLQPVARDGRSLAQNSADPAVTAMTCSDPAGGGRVSTHGSRSKSAPRYCSRRRQPTRRGTGSRASDGGGDHFMSAAAASGASWRQAFRLREPVDSSRRSAKPMRIALSSFLRRAALRVDSSGGQAVSWVARYGPLGNRRPYVIGSKPCAHLLERAPRLWVHLFPAVEP